MRKSAFFVEGQTEQLFVCKLLAEIAGQKQLTIHSCRARGSRAARSLEFGAESAAGDDYFALVVDCGADNAVVSDVRDQYDKLVASGYSSIVAVRDVYPFARADIPTLERAQYLRIKTKPFRPLLLLAVMEVEAWFIGEHSHFERIDSMLTSTAILSAHGFDPSTQDPQNLDNPAADLHAIYSIAGKAYTKTRSNVQRTLHCLDYAELYMSVSTRLPALGALVAAIDNFLS